MAEDQTTHDIKRFQLVYLITQGVGVLILVLICSWVFGHLGGLAWTSNPGVEFNWHPLLMVIGMVFLYGNSILIYRGFRFGRKKTLKLVHGGIHVAAFLFTVIALIAVFDSHNLADKPIPNLYSLHSWLGLSAVILFALQYVCGFVSYLYPGMNEPVRKFYMPLHVLFGLIGFAAAIASCLLGLSEKAFFKVKNYAELPSEAILINTLGMSIVVYGSLVIYLVSETSYKRKALPEDVMLLTGCTSE